MAVHLDWFKMITGCGICFGSFFKCRFSSLKDLKSDPKHMPHPVLLTDKLQMVSIFQPDFKAAVLCEFISILDFLELSHTWAKLSCRLVLEFLSGTVNRIDFYI